MGKAINDSAFCTARGGGGEGNLLFNFKFEIFCLGSEVSVAHSKLMCPS
jgi:hypothetical protein